MTYYISKSWSVVRPKTEGKEIHSVSNQTANNITINDNLIFMAEDKGPRYIENCVYNFKSRFKGGLTKKEIERMLKKHFPKINIQELLKMMGTVVVKVKKGVVVFSHDSIIMGLLMCSLELPNE